MQPRPSKSPSINTPPSGHSDHCACLCPLPLIQTAHCTLLSPQADTRLTPDREIYAAPPSKPLPAATRLPYNPHREVAAVQFNRLYP
jgi:hypothetical protein